MQLPDYAHKYFSDHELGLTDMSCAPLNIGGVSLGSATAPYQANKG